jgi:hypothetical protein
MLKEYFCAEHYSVSSQKGKQEYANEYYEFRHTDFLFIIMKDSSATS